MSAFHKKSTKFQGLFQRVLDGSSKILGRLLLNRDDAFELFDLALFKTN